MARPPQPEVQDSSWALQTAIGVGMLGFAFFGGELLKTQSSITKPMLIGLGVLAVLSALYSRLRRTKPPPPRRPGAR